MALNGILLVNKRAESLSSPGSQALNASSSVSPKRTKICENMSQLTDGAPPNLLRIPTLTGCADASSAVNCSASGPVKLRSGLSIATSTDHNRADADKASAQLGCSPIRPARARAIKRRYSLSKVGSSAVQRWPGSHASQSSTPTPSGLG